MLHSLKSKSNRILNVAKLCHISLHGVANASIHALKLNVVKYECQFPLINLQLHIS